MTEAVDTPHIHGDIWQEIFSHISGDERELAMWCASRTCKQYYVLLSPMIEDEDISLDAYPSWIEYAVQNENIPILEYLPESFISDYYEDGPFDDVIKKNRIKVIEFLCKTEFISAPVLDYEGACSFVCYMKANSIMLNNVEALRVIHKHFPEWACHARGRERDCVVGDENDLIESLECLKFMIDNGYKPDQNLVEIAGEKRKWDVVVYLMNNNFITTNHGDLEEYAHCDRRIDVLHHLYSITNHNKNYEDESFWTCICGGLCETTKRNLARAHYYTKRLIKNRRISDDSLKALLWYKRDQLVDVATKHNNGYDFIEERAEMKQWVDKFACHPYKENKDTAYDGELFRCLDDYRISDVTIRKIWLHYSKEILEMETEYQSRKRKRFKCEFDDNDNTSVKKIKTQ